MPHMKNKTVILVCVVIIVLTFVGVANRLASQTQREIAEEFDNHAIGAKHRAKLWSDNVALRHIAKYQIEGMDDNADLMDKFTKLNENFNSVSKTAQDLIATCEQQQATIDKMESQLAELKKRNRYLEEFRATTLRR